MLGQCHLRAVHHPAIRVDACHFMFIVLELRDSSDWVWSAFHCFPVEAKGIDLQLIYGRDKCRDFPVASEYCIVEILLIIQRARIQINGRFGDHHRS